MLHNISFDLKLNLNEDFEQLIVIDNSKFPFQGAHQAHQMNFQISTSYDITLKTNKYLYYSLIMTLMILGGTNIVLLTWICAFRNRIRRL